VFGHYNVKQFRQYAQSATASWRLAQQPHEFASTAGFALPSKSSNACHQYNLLNTPVE